MLGLVELNATFIFQIINFIAIYFILRHFLFKPVTQFMEKRTKSIADAINEADEKNRESDKLKAQYEDKLKEIKNERNSIIEDASRRAEVRGNEIISQAEAESRKLVEKARLDIEREKQKMMNELKNEISQLAIAAAQKVIEKDINPNDHQKMIQQFIDKAGETQWQS